jgi:DNA-binding GntR family transcriptional regulator
VAVSEEASHAASRPSLVDGAELALRNWLAPGRHREGDRLPPEHDLASMLGVSRGTLRTALRRLEDTGEIVRRQGSGTFVGHIAGTGTLQEGLERLESYASLARRRGMRLGVRDLRIETVAVDVRLAALLGTDPGAQAVQVTRVVLRAGAPMALMVDTIHPSIELPSSEELRTELEREGSMVLDVLTGLSVPVAFSNTSIGTALISPGDPAGAALGVTEPTAVLALDEIHRVTSGQVTHHSRDIFAPEGIDLRVVRWVEAQRPDQVGSPPRPAAPVKRRAASRRSRRR